MDKTNSCLLRLVERAGGVVEPVLDLPHHGVEHLLHLLFVPGVCWRGKVESIYTKKVKTGTCIGADAENRSDQSTPYVCTNVCTCASTISRFCVTVLWRASSPASVRIHCSESSWSS